MCRCKGVKLKKYMKALFILTYSLTYLFSYSLCYAAEREYKILLNNGNSFYGTVYETQGNIIKMGVKGGSLTFEKAEIKDMIPTGNPWKATRSAGGRITPTSKSVSVKNISSIDEVITYLASKYNLDAALIKAVIKAESNFDPYCVSNKGAKGLMQLMPKTALGLGVFDIYSPHQNIEGGVQYLAAQLKDFGDIKLALAAYNAGPEHVKKYRGIPPFAETKNYVRNVLIYWDEYRNKPFTIKKPIYVFTDEQGNIHLSDIKINALYRQLK